jgi:hypothetical protein
MVQTDRGRDKSCSTPAATYGLLTNCSDTILIFGAVEFMRAMLSRAASVMASFSIHQQAITLNPAVG